MLVTTSWSSARADAQAVDGTSSEWRGFGVPLGASEAGIERAQLAFAERIRDHTREDTHATFLHEQRAPSPRTRAPARSRLRLWPWLEAAVAMAAAVSGSSLVLAAQGVQHSRELATFDSTAQGEQPRGQTGTRTRTRAPSLASSALALSMFGAAGLVAAAVKRLTLRTGAADNAWALRIGCTQLTLTTHF
jgi:hypothetical protein